MKREYPIDIVIIWVDGGDPRWLRQKRKYEKDKNDESNSLIRYRDWGQLKYVFRGIDKFMPWINKVFFVTCGQTPEWLNVNHEKIVLVNHADFIPETNLPTFSSSAIEMYLNRIPGLSEHFIYFNDDMFVVNKVSPSDFFKNGLPRDRFVESAIVTNGKKDDMFSKMLLCDIDIINNHFDKQSVIKNNFWKIFNVKNGLRGNLRNLFFLQYSRFSTFENDHVCSSFLKSQIEQVWNNYKDELLRTGGNKFRDPQDVNQYVYKYWQLCSGNFTPRTKGFSKYLTVNDVSRVVKVITGRKYKAICINDSDAVKDFNKVKKAINNAFEVKFNTKSGFEL